MCLVQLNLVGGPKVGGEGYLKAAKIVCAKCSYCWGRCQRMQYFVTFSPAPSKLENQKTKWGLCE